jgi:acetyltransferase-like isoleucine patch superfamily enzyme
VTERRSAFAKPLVHQPPGVREPLRLCVIRALRALITALPTSSAQSGGRLRAFAERLELAELWRTDLLAWRVRRGRQMGMKIGNGCRMYSLNIASEGELIEIGDNVIVSGEVMFVTHDGAICTVLEKFPDLNGHYGRIRIGDRCFIGMRAIIMPGVQLGENCIVAAGAVVTDSFAANSVIAGNPASYACPTSMYMELKRHSPATIYDAAHPFPLPLPADLLRATMEEVPFKVPRRREAGGLLPSAGMRALP